MEISSNSKSLTFKHISVASDEILTYIDNRRLGIVKSLKTRWDKFNTTCNGGIEQNSIYCIAGISGSGKSAFLNSLETDLFDYNHGSEEFVILNFSFEMLASKQVGRKISAKVRKTTSELYRTESPLSDTEFIKVEEEAKKLGKYSIFYVDTPGTVEEIKNTILVFNEKYAKDKWLIVTLDHTLLVKNMNAEKERETLVNLQRMFIELKKFNKTTIIQLSQLNREIEEIGRITNPTLHFPQRRDLSGSDSLFQAVDVMMVIHRPEVLGITRYGIGGWETKDRIYLHVMKNRDGEPKILSFANNLKYNTIDESIQI